MPGKKSGKSSAGNKSMLQTGGGVTAVVDSLNANNENGGSRQRMRTGRGKRFVWIIPDSVVQSSPMQHRKPFDPDNTADDREFLSSVKEHGVIIPIAVRLLEQQAGQTRQYACISGHRRWRAALACGLMEIPAVLYEGITNEKIIHAHTIIENVHRKDLTDMELAQSLHAYKKLFNASLSEVEKSTGVSKSKTSMLLSVLAGPQEVIDLLNDHLIRWRTAYDIGRLPKSNRAKVIAAILSGIDASSAMELLPVGGSNRTTVKPSKNSNAKGFLRSVFEQMPKAAHNAIERANLGDKPARDKLVFLTLAVSAGAQDASWEDALVRYKRMRAPARKRVAKVFEAIGRAYSAARVVSDAQANQVLEATLEFVDILSQDR